MVIMMFSNWIRKSPMRCLLCCSVVKGLTPDLDGMIPETDTPPICCIEVDACLAPLRDTRVLNGLKSSISGDLVNEWGGIEPDIDCV
jgi:hypothetical protein